MTELFTIAECAQKADVSVSTIKRDIADRRIAVTWENGRQYIAAKEWEAYCRAGGSVRGAVVPPDDFSAMVEPALKQLTALYNGPAVYFLFQGQELVYIGQTKKLLERLAKHCKDKLFDGFSFIRCDRNELYRIERWAITKHRPKLNLR